jgi:biotin transport system substrate-specific component
MAMVSTDRVLTEAVWPGEGAALWVKRAVLVVLGVVALTAAAKVRIALPGTPVPMNLGTLAVLSVGAAYGVRLGLVTLLAWLALGVAGFSMFAGSDAADPAKIGWAYMTGGTGGYLVGYVLAAGVLGWLARRGWDRSVGLMAVAMLVGNVVLYVPGLLWLRGFADGWAQTLEWGITPFLVGDAVKLALAALIFPALWRLVGSARA